MKKDRLDSIVSEFISNYLSPDDKEKGAVSDRYTELSNLLSGTKFQSGSHARSTSIKPIHDVDIIWELPEGSLHEDIQRSLSKRISIDEIDVSNILSELSDRLKEDYRKLGVKVIVTPQTHSVCIEYPRSPYEFTVDVVPAVPIHDGLYLVPEILNATHTQRTTRYESQEQIKWIPSDPKGYIQESQDIAEANEAYRPATKLLKSWKRKLKELGSPLELKSFHIEQVVIGLVSKDSSLSLIDSVRSFWENVETTIDTPYIKDKADPDIYIDSYIRELTAEDKALIIAASNRSLNLLDKIETSEDEEEIVRLLRELTLLMEEVESNISNPQKLVQQKPWC